MPRRHTQADDAEVGGQRGREALTRLRNVIGRVEAAWRPATAEESFEIVRRRLFQPFHDAEQFKARDVVAREFSELYRSQQQEFPAECREADYEQRLKAAYPIHPEIFDRLYTDWSALAKFQRTRGVLRLMAAVIHHQWEQGNRSPLIMPGDLALDDGRVQSELTRYLDDNWAPIIEKDVDGAGSLPLRIDAEQPNLGKFSASRRVARAIFLGSAPTMGAAHRGIEDRRVKLGCVMPGESPAVFGDALRRLATGCHLPVRGQRPLLVRHAADGHQAGGGSSRADAAQSRSHRPGDRRAHAGRAAAVRRLQSRASVAALRSRRARRPGRAARRLGGRAFVWQGRRERGGDAGAGDPGVARHHPAHLPQHAGVPCRRRDASAGARRGGAPLPGVGVDRRRARSAQSGSPAGAAGGDEA